MLDGLPDEEERGVWRGASDESIERHYALTACYTSCSDVKLERWYTDWGLGSSTTISTGDLRRDFWGYDTYAVGWSDDDNFSMGFDFLEVYWPLENQQTIL